MKLEVFRTLTYYRSVNQKFQQKAPSFYHSRFYPFDLMSRGISASTPEFNLSSILIEVEEWMGEDFTSSIVT
jgi:hypothetical protein